MEKNTIKLNEGELRQMVSKVIKESLRAAKPWVNDTGYQVGNWDDREAPPALPSSRLSAHASQS